MNRTDPYLLAQSLYMGRMDPMPDPAWQPGLQQVVAELASLTISTVDVNCRGPMNTSTEQSYMQHTIAPAKADRSEGF